MSFNKLLLLASAASLTSITGVQGARAADLPARQVAPIEYVRICDAYGRRGEDAATGSHRWFLHGIFG